MAIPAQTITACILARNEASRIEPALQSLQSWTDQILVIDNQSEDDTVAIASRYTEHILTAPRSKNFDAARNLAIEHATGEWIFYLDADERVPPALGEAIRRLVQEKGEEFEAVCFPFKHFFCGQWMQHCNWWPGYTRPQLVKKGRFSYNERLHSGIQVDGRTIYFPADDPDLAILHYSYDNLHHYLTKLNHYTDGEAENLYADGASHTWQAILAHFVHDWQVYYERGRGDLDGMHGFVLSFLSAFYRFASRAKLWDLRRQKGEAWEDEPVPSSLREMLEFMARVTQEGAALWLRPSHSPNSGSPTRLPADWLKSSPPAAKAKKRRTSAAKSGITACILARNEANRIETALQSLQGWTDQILVIDNQSEDDTAKIARRYADQVLSSPVMLNFDGARNLAIEHATGEWIFYLDADERVPSALGETIRRLVQEKGSEFEAIAFPFKNFYYGRWMQSAVWWPGYKGPQLVRKGAFRFGERLHEGAKVAGRVLEFPADDPELAIRHEACDTLHQYLDKLNRYTDGEAENLYADEATHSWQGMLAHFTHDWQTHYDHLQARQDGMQGFVQSFLCALYRFVSRAKLWDLRRQKGEVRADEPVPANLRETLEFMARVTQQGAGQWLQPTASIASAQQNSISALPRVPLLWHGPLFDASGYADEARSLLLGCLAAGEKIALAPQVWNPQEAVLPAGEREALTKCLISEEAIPDLLVTHTLPYLLRRASNARFQIARTVFETDRLVPEWVPVLNSMDRVWVTSEFNRDTFAASGVQSGKIAIVPEALDTEAFARSAEPWPLPGNEAYKFLSVFDWTLHKGWDILLDAFARAHGDNPDVGLVIKTWSSNGYTFAQLEQQADALLRERFSKGLADFPNIHLWQETLTVADMPRLYRGADCFVLPTRGEGWCRPLMEAMACGLPTIATGWSGLTAFHDSAVGYPLKYELVPVPETGWQEIPLYRGHHWAEPDSRDLQRLLRHVVAKQEAARKKGSAAQKRISTRYSRAAVAEIVRAELALCREQMALKPDVRPVASIPAPAVRPAHPLPLRPPANPVPTDPVPTVDFVQTLDRPLRVRWEGDQFILSSLAHVNREFCLGLLDRGDVELSVQAGSDPDWHNLTARDDPRFAALLARRNAVLSGPPDVTIRHHFPPNWTRPETGKLVVIQPWERSHLPGTDWLEGALQADEVWAYSRFVRDVYARSGVPAEKVRIVPLGVRTDVFTPDGPRYALPPGRNDFAPFRFLFVGGTITRKGADLLLQAYRLAFTPQDNVCLVVKDMGTRTFYQGQHLGAAFQQMQADARMPRVIYMEHNLAEASLASLYRACDCVVLPYRGEGFGLAPLEGMACGLPAIVTSGGPTDDYLDDTLALRVPHHRLVQRGAYKGPNAFPVDPWDLEPDMEGLVEALRWAYAHADQMRERGRTAREYVARGWTWDRAVDVARERLHTLLPPVKDQQAFVAVPWPAAPVKRTTSKKTVKPVELSLCMIARNEGARLEECLRSIAPYVDEMVVVDTGSTDNTREIAQQCGARVFEMPWPDSFAAARNQSLEQARGQWIFWMDADDVIPPECGKQLRELIRRHPKRDAAYQVQVRIPPGPGEYSVSVVDHVKLFPNRPDARFEHRIHEQVLPSLRRAGMDVRFSDLYVTHQNYDRSPAGQAGKRQRDFRLLELDIADRPDHPFTLFNLGMTHLYATKEYEVAAQYLQRSLNASHWRDSIVRKAYALLTMARICQQDWLLASLANKAGREHYPDDAELLFQAGQVYQHLGRFEEARAALERLLQGTDDPHYRSVDLSLRTYRGQHELALLYRRMGDADHCVAALRALLAQQPEYMPGWRDLAATLHGTGRAAEAQRLLAGLPGQGKVSGTNNLLSASAYSEAERSMISPQTLDVVKDALVDCLGRTRLVSPTTPLKAQRCIATVVSPGYEALLDGLLISLTARGGCTDTTIVVVSVDGNEECTRIIARHGAVEVACTSLVPRNPTVKSVLYSIARIVEAQEYLCLDADMLVLDSLAPVFAALRREPEGSILVCRDQGLTARTLGEELCGFYGGRPADIEFLLGTPGVEGAYPLIVNDGLFAGGRKALLDLDALLRKMLPNSIAWVDGYLGHGCRNQFLFNLALAHLGRGVELDQSFNFQLHVRDVETVETGRVLGEGKPVHVLHFCGPGRSKYETWKTRLLQGATRNTKTRGASKPKASK